MIDVVWLDYRDDADGPSSGRGYWDQGMFEALFAGTLYPTSKRHTFRHWERRTWPEDTPGGIVVFKGGNNADQLHTLTQDIAEHFPEWCLLITAGDEEDRVDWSRISHANLTRWIALPRPLSHRDCPDGTRYFGCGWPADAPALLHATERTVAWSYAGQVNHSRRHEAVTAAQQLDVPGELHPSPGFTQGLDRASYYDLMSRSKLILCPSGPTTPDTFRMWEALEAGCLPLVDLKTPDDKVPGYYPFLLGGEPPFPTVDTWDTDLPDLVANGLNDWPANVNRVWAWWQQWKRNMAWGLIDDIAGMRGPEPDTAADVTFLIATSPIPNHPDDSTLVETVESIRAQQPDAEIIIMCDGVRAEQEHRRADYEEYLNRVLTRCAREWAGVVPVIFEHLTQQADMIRQTLAMVRTPYLMFVEHDTPLCGDIPWEPMKQVIADGEADMIRLYPNTDLEPSHLHMFHDRQTIHGVPLLRTHQYSSRPHLTSTAFMRRMLDTWFQPGVPMFLELRMHSVLSNLWAADGILGWNQCRTWIYEPEGNLQRSLHSNGRGDDPAFPT